MDENNRLTKVQQEALQAALSYHDQGWAVIPVKYRSKVAEADWKRYQQERPSREQVERWFGDGKDHNIGIITGQISGDLVVLVFNDEGDFKKFFEGDNILEKTLVIKTPRGYHVYLTVSEVTKSHIYGGGRFEIKGEGTYVVAPPSMHPKEVQYYEINPD
jgi:hypothetical protein